MKHKQVNKDEEATGSLHLLAFRVSRAVDSKFREKHFSRLSQVLKVDQPQVTIEYENIHSWRRETCGVQVSSGKKSSSILCWNPRTEVILDIRGATRVDSLSGKGQVNFTFETSKEGSETGK